MAYINLNDIFSIIFVNSYFGNFHCCIQRVERELHGKTQAHNHVFQYAISQEQCPSSTATTLPHMLNIDIAMQQQKQQGKYMILFISIIILHVGYCI